jgi:hypothetical protein
MSYQIVLNKISVTNASVAVIVLILVIPSNEFTHDVSALHDHGVDNHKHVDPSGLNGKNGIVLTNITPANNLVHKKSMARTYPAAFSLGFNIICTLL